MDTTSTCELPAPVSFPALGTTAVVAVTDSTARADAVEILRDELDAIDRACSRFRDDSELSVLHATPATWIDASPLFVAALDVAVAAAEATSGLVDPTVGRAVRVLGYDRDFATVASEGGELRVRVQRAPGWRGIEIDHAAGRVRVPRGVEIDLGATAKAFAADRAAGRIASETGTGVLVDLGGDCALAGPAPLGGWNIRIADRHDAGPDAPGVTVALDHGGLATSGTAARRWSRGGRALHHVVDPATGWSAPEVWRTATVAAATCVDANVATTASIVLGAPAPDWLAERGLPGRLVRPDGTVVTVGGWPDEPTEPVAATGGDNMASVTSPHFASR